MKERIIELLRRYLGQDSVMQQVENDFDMQWLKEGGTDDHITHTIESEIYRALHFFELMSPNNATLLSFDLLKLIKHDANNHLPLDGTLRMFAETVSLFGHMETVDGKRLSKFDPNIIPYFHRALREVLQAFGVNHLMLAVIVARLVCSASSTLQGLGASATPDGQLSPMLQSYLDSLLVTLKAYPTLGEVRNNALREYVCEDKTVRNVLEIQQEKLIDLYTLIAKSPARDKSVLIIQELAKQRKHLPIIVAARNKFLEYLLSIESANEFGKVGRQKGYKEKFAEMICFLISTGENANLAADFLKNLGDAILRRAIELNCMSNVSLISFLYQILVVSKPLISKMMAVGEINPLLQVLEQQYLMPESKFTELCNPQRNQFTQPASDLQSTGPIIRPEQSFGVMGHFGANHPSRRVLPFASTCQAENEIPRSRL